MKNYNELLQKTHLAFRMNIIKLVFAFFLSIMVMWAGNIIVFLPVAISIMAVEAITSFHFLLVLCSSFLIIVLFFLLQYGYFVLNIRFLTQKRAVIGQVFSAFYDKSRAIRLALFFTSIYIFLSLALSLISVVSGFFSMDSILSFFSATEKQNTSFIIRLVILMGIIIVFFVLVFIRYGFAWFILHDNPTIGVLQSLKQSVALNKQQFGSCLMFIIQAIARYAISTIILLALILFINVTRFSSIYAFLSFLKIAFAISYFGMIIKFAFAFTAWYVYHTFKKNQQDDDIKELESEQLFINAP